MVWDRSFDLLQCTVPFPLTQTGAGLRGMNILTDIVTGPYFCHKSKGSVYILSVWLQCMFIDVLIDICCLWQV